MAARTLDTDRIGPVDPRGPVRRLARAAIGGLALAVTTGLTLAGPAVAAPATGSAVGSAVGAAAGSSTLSPTASSTASRGATATGTALPGRSSACRSPLVYLVPHQDDEVLSMSASIRRTIARSGPGCVHVVLVTTGESSGARTTLARGFRAGGHGITRVSLSRAQFGASRDKEFRASVARLGVPAANVHLGLPDAPRIADDGSLDAAAARRVVDAAIDRFGRAASYATMSDSDPQADHRRLGEALREAGTRRRVASATYFFPPYQLPAPRTLSPTTATSRADRDAITRAAREYGTYAPKSGRYGIGWLSVPGAFGGPALGVRMLTASGTLWQAPALRRPKSALLTDYTSYLHR